MLIVQRDDMKTQTAAPRYGLVEWEVAAYPWNLKEEDKSAAKWNVVFIKGLNCTETVFQHFPLF